MLKSMKFEIGGKEIELTEEEARQLQGELNQVFGSPPVSIPYIPYVWPVDPTQPWVTYGGDTTWSSNVIVNSN
jgi:hypothetical protein